MNSLRMKKITNIIITIFTVVGLCSLIGFAMSTPVNAQVNVFPQCGSSVDSEVCKGGGKLFGPGSIWNRILNTLTFIIGAISVLMVIIGGLRYTVSNGDQAGITSAKNTIIYALVGLVIAVMANAIVNFVLTNI